MAGPDAQEGRQVEVPLDPDRQPANADTPGSGAGCHSDGEAVAQGRQQLFDRIRGLVGATQALGLVRRDRAEVADATLTAETTGPGDLRLPRGGGAGGILVAGVGQARHRLDVDVVQGNGCAHVSTPSSREVVLGPTAGPIAPGRRSGSTRTAMDRPEAGHTHRYE